VQALKELGTEQAVAQQYLKNPFLVNGLKLDMRIYSLVLSCDPLRIFIYQEGLVRFCTQAYEAPKRDNLASTYMHLTNYAINRRNEDFGFNESDSTTDEGSKWSLTAFFKYLDAQGKADL
jgi:tubulin polyglutamylase TTLL6/13